MVEAPADPAWLVRARGHVVGGLDIELLFVWPWATVFKNLGWFGYSIMLVFLGVLMLGFLYIWQKRGLEWE